MRACEDSPTSESGRKMTDILQLEELEHCINKQITYVHALCISSLQVRGPRSEAVRLVAAAPLPIVQRQENRTALL
jgi:hypothetical protein